MLNNFFKLVLPLRYDEVKYSNDVRSVSHVYLLLSIDAGEIMATFDTRLKKLRQEKGILQDTLADEIGVTKGTVSVWERGVRKPDFTTIEKLAVYFNVTIP